MAAEDYPRFLYLNQNVGWGAKSLDRPEWLYLYQNAGWGPGILDRPEFLYLYQNVGIGTVDPCDFVMVPGPLALGDALIQASEIRRISMFMNWKDKWVPGEYLAADTLRDGAWTMVANKQTIDRPAPQPLGSPEYAIDPDPTWVTLSPTVTFLGTGTRFVFTEPGWVNSWRVWIPTVSVNNLYTAVLYDQTDPDHIIETSVKITPTQVGWFTVLITPSLTLVGTDVVLSIYAQNDAGKAPHTGPWSYLGQSTPVADPGSGNFGRNNGGTVVRVNSTDQDGLSRDGELAEITPGVELNFNDGEWIVRVDTATDMTGWWQFNVTPQSGGLSNDADGIKPIFWEISAPQPTDYVKVDDYWVTNQPSWATVTGLYTDEPLGASVLTTRLGAYVQPMAAPVEGNTGYGADIEFQPASVSPDWDVLAVDR